MPDAIVPPSPEKNQVSSAPMDQAGAIEYFKKQVASLTQITGIAPAMISKIGELAVGALKDPALYPMFQQALVQNKIADQKDFTPGIDKKMLGYFIALGKTASHQLTGVAS